MKILVVSDIHGSYHYAKKIKDIYEREKPERIILLGDLYYHGPRNPLTDEYDPMKVAGILNDYSDIITCIRGNCDAEVDEMISDFKFHDFDEEKINGKIFFFTHGHIYNRDRMPENIDVLVYGHLHTGFIEVENDVICVNSGSISLPKNGTAHSYLIIDDEKIYLKDEGGNLIKEIKY